MSTTADFGRGKTIFVLAIVIGCFAVLWPKIFYPMLTASISQTQADNVPIPPPRAQTVRKGAQQSICCDVISERDTNAYLVMTGICSNIMRNYEMIQEQQRQQQQQQQQGKQRKYTPVVKVSTVTLCRNEILQTCGVDIIALLKEDPSITTEYKKSLGQLRSFNTSLCMKMNYGVDFREIGQARKIKGPEVVPSHVRQERPFRPGPDMVHPALRERGRGIPTVNIPRRTIEREARPGPVPGMRPPVGGAGHIAQQKGGGTMGIIMPMYTIGIVCFFLYTILKILFKKSPEAEQAKPPPVKEYGLDTTEHRKYYEEQSVKEALYKEDMGLRRRPSGGKPRFYEDRRKLESPTVIYPTYPSDLDPTKTDPTTATTPEFGSGVPSVTTDMRTKESFETPPVSPPITENIASTSVEDTVTLTDQKKTAIEPLAYSQLEPEIESKPERQITPMHEPILHESKEGEETATSLLIPTESTVVPSVEVERKDLEPAAEEIVHKQTFTEDAAPIASPSTDDVVRVPAAEKSSDSNIFSETDTGPFSPLAPDQTPNPETEPVHFFDRTIIIPDYEPGKEPETEKSTGTEAEEPQITIVDQASVPEKVLEMADQVAEKILEDVKQEWKLSEEAAVSTSARPGESLFLHEDTETDTGISYPIATSPIPDLSKPRLSLDISLTETNQELGTAAATTAIADESTTTTTPLTKSLDADDGDSKISSEESNQSSISSATTVVTSPPSQIITPPDIQVETPHADQTELNRIAEFLETLNTEPKEAAKLAATMPEILGEGIGSSEPIVTLVEEIKQSRSLEDDLGHAPSALEGGSRCKLEITPVDESQLLSSEKIDLPDICYVTQPIDENQKGRNRASFLRSSVEIVSIDESEPTVRKVSEPLVNVAQAGADIESLEQTLKKLKHVPEQAAGSSLSQKESAKRRKSSVASDISVDSQKASEIDKYLGRMADAQSLTRAMIEREIFKSSSMSSQQSESGEREKEQADQSSNFHGPGLLDSGQIVVVNDDDTEQPLTVEGLDLGEKEIIDKMKEVEKWATATMVAVASAAAARVELEDDPGGKVSDVLSQIMETAPIMREDKIEIAPELDMDELVKEMEPLGTADTFIELLPVTQISPKIMTKVDSLIDQALRDGIEEAVRILVENNQIVKEDFLTDSSNLELVEKLDQVLEEIGSENVKGNVLESISVTEMASEDVETAVIEPAEDKLTTVVETETNPNLCGSPCLDTKTSTDTDGEMTDQSIKQAFTHKDRIITAQTSSNTDLKSCSQDNTITTESAIESNLASTVFEKCNVGIDQITEECENTSSATAEASATSDIITPTQTQSEPIPSNNPPFISDAQSSLDRNQIKDVEHQKDEVAGDNKDQSGPQLAHEEETGGESQEPIIAELETIQEEIENLNTALTAMESAAAIKAQESNVTVPEKVSTVEPPKESADDIRKNEPEVIVENVSLLTLDDKSLVPVVESQTEKTVKPIEASEEIQIVDAHEQPMSVSPILDKPEVEVAQQPISSLDNTFPQLNEPIAPIEAADSIIVDLSSTTTEIAKPGEITQSDLGVTEPLPLLKPIEETLAQVSEKSEDSVVTLPAPVEVPAGAIVESCKTEEPKVVGKPKSDEQDTSQEEAKNTEAAKSHENLPLGVSALISAPLEAEKSVPSVAQRKDQGETSLVEVQLQEDKSRNDEAKKVEESTPAETLPPESVPPPDQIELASPKTESLPQSQIDEAANIEKPESQSAQIERPQNTETIQALTSEETQIPIEEPMKTDTSPTEPIPSAESLTLPTPVEEPLLLDTSTVADAFNASSFEQISETDLSNTTLQTAQVDIGLSEVAPELPPRQKRQGTTSPLSRAESPHEVSTSGTQTLLVAKAVLSRTPSPAPEAATTEQPEQPTEIPHKCEQSSQTITTMIATPLRFETLSEPPFPIPSTTPPHTIPENNSVTVSENSCLVDSKTNADTPLGEPRSLALTVEMLDENSPEIFPLAPSSTSATNETLPCPTSPVEKAQSGEQAGTGEKQSTSVDVAIVGVSLATTIDIDTTGADQASSVSSLTTTTTTNAAAEQQATQASSASASATIDTDTTSTTISSVATPTTPTPTPLRETEEKSSPTTNYDQVILSSEKIITDDNYGTPAVSSVNEPRSIPSQDNAQPSRNEEPGDVEIDMLRKRLEETEAAMERIVTQMGSVSDQLTPTVLAQVLRAEDLEKLISKGESKSKKEDLAATATAAGKEKRREKTPSRSTEKEVKFKLPPEEMEEEEVEPELARPPTPPKTLSKAKTKSPSPTPEPCGTHALLPTTSSQLQSHRDHDELLISSMQTTVAGSAADTDNYNKSPCPSPIAITFRDSNNTTTTTILTPPPQQYTVKATEQAPLAIANLDDDNNDTREQISDPITIIANDNDKQSAAAAIAQAKAAGASSPSPTSGVSVIGIEETASLITGERWDLNRTPTPTFRQPTPPMPHRPPSPPDNIPSIYLEGPMPTRGQELVVRESQIEVEGDEYDYEFDDEYEPSGPVILSGKVTLSVISSAAGPFITDEVTDAPSLSLDDRAQAEHSSRGKSPAGATGGSRKNVAAEIASAMNDEVKGKSKAGKKSSNASSPDMDEYEVIGKGGYRGQDEETDVSLDDYLTATDAEPEGDRAQEDTAADISTMDDLKPEQLPPDEE